MYRFRTSLVLGLSMLLGACGGNADTNTLRTLDVPADGGLGGGENLAGGGSGGSEFAPDAGLGGAGGAGTGGAEQGGAGGSDIAQGGTGGSGQGGQGGSDVNQGGSDQGGTDGGAGGSDVSQGGTNQGGTGGTEQGGAGQGGAGGSDVGQGGSEQGGAGGSDVVEPECEGSFSRCNGNVYEECDRGVYLTYQCSAEVGLNCYPGEGCAGECLDGETRCTGETAETCVYGGWTTSEACPFQCVNGACAGTCTPGDVVCDGAALATCGSDFQYGSPVACPTDPNGSASCSAAECSLSCNAGFDDCDGNGSCEADLSTTTTCGACGTVCDPNPANASPACTVSGCGLTCDAGFDDCDGDPSNGCELNIATDALNCGACGNSCYGTACEAGQCEYAFEVVSDDSDIDASVPDRVQKQVQDLVVTDTYVYWLTRTELRRAPKAGGSYETLTALTAQPSTNRQKTLVVEAGKVVWATQDGVDVIPETGGSPTRIFTTTGLTAVRGLLSTNGKLYWNDSQLDGVSGGCASSPSVTNEATFLTCSNGHQTTFRTYDLTLGQFSSWQLSGEHSPPLAVIGNTMYVANFGATWPGTAQYAIRLNSYNATTGAWITQIGGTFNVSGNFTEAYNTFFGAAVASDTLVYSTDLRGGASTGFATAPLAGGTNVPVTVGASSREFVLDASTLYYRGGSNFTSVQAISLTGEALDPIFQGKTNDFLQIAQDDTHIYFTAYTPDGEQAILRAPK